MPLRGFENIALALVCEDRWRADNHNSKNKVDRGPWLKHAVHSATYSRRIFGGHSQIVGHLVSRYWSTEAIFNWYHGGYP